MMDNTIEPLNPYEALKSLVELTSPHVGDQFLKVTCDALKELMHADLVFITHRMDTPSNTVKVLASSTPIVDSFELKGTPCELVYDNDDFVLVKEGVCTTFPSSKETDFESFIGIPLYDKDRACIGHITILSQKKRIHDPYIEEISLLFSRRVESEIRRVLLEEELQRLTTLDPLTELFNRRFITSHASGVLAQIKREPFDATLIFLDADDFKKVNDTYGHTKGDAVLCRIAEIIQEECREGIDTPARFGGEEFCIISTHTNEKEATHLAKRIQKQLQSFFTSQKELACSITLSIGISRFKSNHTNWDDVYKEADSAMYQAKHSGKNCIRYFK